MKTRLVLLAALATTASLAVVATPAVASAPTIDIRPAQLPRGDAARVPHLEGRTIVDGEVRVRAPRSTYLLGRSGDAYVVAGSTGVLRVAADGSTTRIARPAGDASLLLSQDGGHVLATTYGRTGRTRVTVLDATSGDRVASRVFARYATVLDADEDRAVLTASAPDRTFWWNHRSDATSRINDRSGGVADIAANRLTTFTGDPYQGGCAVVTTLTQPRRQLWRSCREAPFAFSPDGARMVTAHILSDGLGPGEVHVRRTRGGAAVASYRAYYFGSVAWETDRALVMEAHSRTRAAWVRCTGATCERTSKVTRSR